MVLPDRINWTFAPFSVMEPPLRPDESRTSSAMLFEPDVMSPAMCTLDADEVACLASAKICDGDLVDSPLVSDELDAELQADRMAPVESRPRTRNRALPGARSVMHLSVPVGPALEAAFGNAAGPTRRSTLRSTADLPDQECDGVRSTLLNRQENEPLVLLAIVDDADHDWTNPGAILFFVIPACAAGVEPLKIDTTKL